MKKIKLLSFITIAILSSIIFAACSCSKPKEIPATDILLTTDVVNHVFVGETFNLNYSVNPHNATSVKVTVTSSNTNAITLSKSTLSGRDGMLQGTAVGVHESGLETVVLTFRVSNTDVVRTLNILVRAVPEQLSAPSELTYNSFTQTITFLSVPGAASYSLNINGSIVNVTDPNVSNLEPHVVSYTAFGGSSSLSPDVDYIVTVRANGNLVTTATGEFSEQSIAFRKMAPPQNITAVNGVLTWDEVVMPEISGYIVEVNGVESGVITQNFYNLGITVAGTTTARVRTVNIASAEEEYATIYNSDFSAAYSVEKLQQPIGLAVSNTVLTEGFYSYSEFSWGLVSRASGYRVTITPGLNEATTIIDFDAQEPRKVFINEDFLANTPYTFSVIALGNNNTTLNSATSTYTFTKLDTVSNVYITNDILYFEPLIAAVNVTYEVLIISQTATIRRVLDTYSLNLTDIVPAYGDYDIYILSIAQHDLVAFNYFAHSDRLDTGVSFTKLQAPTVNGVDNQARVWWGLIDSAIAYEIYLDNQYVASVDVLVDLQGATEGVYQLQDIEAGNYTVAVVAVGDGSSYITSSRVAKVQHSFTKLDKVSEVNVSNDIVTWVHITGTTYYSVSVNGGLTFVPIGANPTYTITSDSVTNIQIIATGNDGSFAGTSIISSDIAEFVLNRLATPQNLRVSNGVVLWDTETNVEYSILIDDTQVARVTSGTYSFNTLAQGADKLIKIKAYPLTGLEGNTYLSSAIVTITLNRLNAPDIATFVATKINDQQYTIAWGAITNAAEYRVVITTTGVTDTSEVVSPFNTTNTYFTIPYSWFSGKYDFRVMAIGNSVAAGGGVGYLNSASSGNYSMVKLSTPGSVRVENNILRWNQPASQNSATPTGYEVVLTSGGIDNVVILGGTSTSYNVSGYVGEFVVKIRAIGTETSIMTSNYSSELSVEKLDTISTLRVNENDTVDLAFDFEWDSYNTSYGTSFETIYYDIYLKENGQTEFSLLATVTNNTKYKLTQVVQTNVVHTLKMIVRVTNYINSDYSADFEFIKFSVVSGFDINNKTFSWSQTEFTDKYQIIETLGTNYNVMVQNSLTSDFVQTIARKYAFKIRALGGQDNGINYISSDYTANLDVAILTNVGQAGNITVSGGKLNWLPSYTLGDELNTPVSYTIKVYSYINETDYDPTPILTLTGISISATEHDLSTLTTGMYRFEIISVGNNKNKIDSNPAVIEFVEKINANALTLRSVNGTLTWDEFIGNGVTYDIYINGALATTISNNTYIPTGLTPLAVYSVQIRVHAQNQLSSLLSSPINVVQLPQVTSFRTTKIALSHYFEWDLMEQLGVEIASFYEILPVTPLPEFNEGLINAGTNSLLYTYTQNPGTYLFKIRAIGSTTTSGTHYLTGEYTNDISVTVLDTVRNLTLENNRLNFTPSPLFTDANNSPDFYRIEVYNVNDLDNIYKLIPNHPTSVHYYNFTDVEAGVYVVYIISMSNSNTKVSSTFAEFTNAVVLPAPDNVKITSGVLSFDEVSYEGITVSYEIYLGASVTPLITITNNTFAEVDKINKAITSTQIAQTLRIKTISDSAINSGYSYTINITKLSSVTGMSIILVDNASVLKWTNVANTNTYRIITSVTQPFEGLQYYNLAGGYFEIVADGAIGFAIPIDIDPSSYWFKVVAVGNSTLSESIEMGYLNSNDSAQTSFTLLSSPQNLRVESGIVRWSSVTGAQNYRLEFNRSGDIIVKTALTNSYDMNSDEFISGDYVLRVYTVGNGTTYITSTDYAELSIIRGNAPANFKIFGGYLQWTVSESMVLQYVYGSPSGNLDIEDRYKVISVFNGTSTTTSQALQQNLWPLYHLELIVNGIVYSVTPSYVTYVLSNFYLQYDLPLPSIAVPYNIRARMMGNSSANNSFSGEVLSGMDEQTYQVYSYVHSLYTPVITAHKLSSPITPIVAGQTSIENNILRWVTVQTPQTTQVLNYYVIATAANGDSATITALVTVGVGTTIAQIDIRDLEDYLTLSTVVPGIPYNIYVKAAGTMDSSLSVAPYYLTSSYTNTAQIELLAEPNSFKVTDGAITFVPNIRATEHILTITNDAFGINETIFINQTTLENNPYLVQSPEGYIAYIMQDNLLFPALTTPYSVRVIAKGNGVTTIDSSEKSPISVVKWHSVELDGNTYDITVEEGMYKWTHISYYDSYSNTTYKPTQYRVVIIKTNPDPEFETKNYIFILDNLNFADNYIYFELPVTDEFGSHHTDSTPYTYSILVVAMGSTSSAEGNGLWFANSNSKLSKTAQRLATPKDLTTLNGIVVYSSVTWASRYELLISDVYYNNNTLLSFEFGPSYTAGVYNLAVRARGTAINGNYLNGRFAEAIKIIKYETPDLRLHQGDIKWNNTDLSYALANLVQLSIEGPAGFNTNQLTGLNGITFTENAGVYTANLPFNHVVNTISGLSLKGTPAGEYFITIKYIGGSGQITSGEDVYHLVNSNPIAFTFIKLETPVASYDTAVIEGDVVNYVQWEEIDNAIYYNAVISKYDQGQLVHRVKISSLTNPEYFSVVATNIRFNLGAVNDYDTNNPTQPQFGGEFTIHIEAFANNSSATLAEARYSMSNDSNILYINIPQTPINLTLNDYGTLTWTNITNEAYPVLEITYPGGFVEEVLLGYGVSSYKLTVVSNNSYTIRIKSITGTLQNPIAQSEFSSPTFGRFELFASGSGTEIDPYVINTGMQLYNINYYTESHYILGQNISTDGIADIYQWKPIGVSDGLFIPNSSFTGVLNGNGYSINTITFPSLTADNLAFIHTIGATGVVKNLNLNVLATNVNALRFAGLAVYNFGLIDNVTVSGTIGVKQLRSEVFVGGVVVQNYPSGIITQTRNLANIVTESGSNVQSTVAGGIAYRNDGTLNKVGNDGSILASSLGGIVYLNYATITDAYNKGALKSLTLEGYTRAQIFIGGIAAVNETGGTISYSYVLNYENIEIENIATNNIITVSAYVGGLIGNNASNSTINSNYVVFRMGIINTTRVQRQVGAMAGLSQYTLTNYSNNYYQAVSGLFAVGGSGSAVNGVVTRSEVQMKNSNFVTELGSTHYVANTGDYPSLLWE